jgi:hypothetical protein
MQQDKKREAWSAPARRKITPGPAKVSCQSKSAATVAVDGGAVAAIVLLRLPLLLLLCCCCCAAAVWPCDGMPAGEKQKLAVKIG